jgi:TPR repeat protein
MKEFAREVLEARKRADENALFALGVKAYRGEDIPIDNELAHELFTSAAVQEHARAMAQLGFMSATGRGTVQDDAVGLEWLRRGAVAGHGTSMFNYARQCAEGLGCAEGKPDYPTAERWYRTAVAGPYPAAILNLSILLLKGFAGDSKREEGRRLLEEAADPRGRNLVSAQASLGILLEGGRPELGIPRDAERAASFLALASAAGRTDDVARAFARCALWGRGMPKSFEKAKAVLLGAVEKGNEEAAEDLMGMLAHGTGGFPKCNVGLAALGSLCAEKGLWDAVWRIQSSLHSSPGASAQDLQKSYNLCLAGNHARGGAFAASLAFMLYTGCGCAVNFGESRAASLVAAKDGIQSAMSNVAEMMWQGLGGERDIQGALEWWNKAANDEWGECAILTLQLVEEGGGGGRRAWLGPRLQ